MSSVVKSEAEISSSNKNNLQIKTVTTNLNNLKMITEIGLFPANINRAEVIVTDVSCNFPISIAAKFVKNR